MGYRRQPSNWPGKSGNRRRSLLDFFFPDWRQARDRQRKGVAAIFLLAFAVVLLLALARHFGFEPAALLSWFRQA